MYLGMTVTLWGGWLRASAWTFDNARRCSNTLAVVRWRSDGQTADQLHVMREALSRLDEELRRQGDDSSSGVSSEVPLRDGGRRDDADGLPVSAAALDIRPGVGRH